MSTIDPYSQAFDSIQQNLDLCNEAIGDIETYLGNLKTTTIVSYFFAAPNRIDEKIKKNIEVKVKEQGGDQVLGVGKKNIWDKIAQQNLKKHYPKTLYELRLDKANGQFPKNMWLANITDPWIVKHSGKIQAIFKQKGKQSTKRLNRLKQTYTKTYNISDKREIKVIEKVFDDIFSGNGSDQGKTNQKKSLEWSNELMSYLKTQTEDSIITQWIGGESRHPVSALACKITQFVQDIHQAIASPSKKEEKPSNFITQLKKHFVTNQKKSSESEAGDPLENFLQQKFTDSYKSFQETKPSGLKKLGEEGEEKQKERRFLILCQIFKVDECLKSTMNFQKSMSTLSPIPFSASRRARKRSISVSVTPKKRRNDHSLRRRSQRAFRVLGSSSSPGKKHKGVTDSVEQYIWKLYTTVEELNQLIRMLYSTNVEKKDEKDNDDDKNEYKEFQPRITYSKAIISAFLQKVGMLLVSQNPEKLSTQEKNKVKSIPEKPEPEQQQQQTRSEVLRQRKDSKGKRRQGVRPQSKQTD